jgi:hypothetical protein
MYYTSQKLFLHKVITNLGIKLLRMVPPKIVFISTCIFFDNYFYMYLIYDDVNFFWFL